MIKEIISRIRLIFRKKKKPYSRFFNILGFYPNNISYYQLALRHKSIPIRTKDGRELSNERLEFLGDAVLNLVITDLIYRKYEDKGEGFLTSLRAKIVSRESLNQIAIELGLNQLVVASRYVIRHTNNNVYGNALEALFGAIYLDYGYKKCKQFVEKVLFREFLDWEEILQNEINYKSKVFEWCHKNQLEPEFVLVGENVTGNRHTFRTCIIINGNIICEAEGSSKKESQQNASRIAYDYITQDPHFLEKIS